MIKDSDGSIAGCHETEDAAKQQLAALYANDGKGRQLKGRRAVFPMSRVKIEEKAGSDGKRRFEGYAAVFGNRDAHGDIIMKGAFEKSLVEHPDIKVLWQHDTKQPMGLSEQAIEDDYGLRVRGVLTNIPLVTDTVVPLMEDGVVNGLSIGYDVIVEEHNTDLEAWLLKEIELWEYSPVTFPANERAIVSQVKSLDSKSDMHEATVERHAKTLIHELEGFFAQSDRRDGLNLEQLKVLHGLVGGLLPDAEPDEQSTADVDHLLKLAHDQGVNHGLELAKELRT